MPKMIWTEKYEIGIQVIDQQHHRILDYINDVYDVPVDTCRDSVLKEVLNNLVDYTLSHFEFEEALMEEAEYADLPEHQLTHRNFIRIIEQLKQRFDDGEPVAEELADVLQKWLLSHIMTDDQSYAGVVRQRIVNKAAITDRQQNWLTMAMDRCFK